MKISNTLFALAVLAIATGCRTGEERTASSTSTSSRQITETSSGQRSTPVSNDPQEAAILAQGRVLVDDPDYTVETIPNPHLSPTSREGDKLNQVYSSNIIAVYVHPRNGVTVVSTNSTAIPVPANNPQPQKK
jgi:hypothetical protein